MQLEWPCESAYVIWISANGCCLCTYCARAIGRRGLPLSNHSFWINRESRIDMQNHMHNCILWAYVFTLDCARASYKCICMLLLLQLLLLTIYRLLTSHVRSCVCVCMCLMICFEQWHHSPFNLAAMWIPQYWNWFLSVTYGKYNIHEISMKRYLRHPFLSFIWTSSVKQDKNFTEKQEASRRENIEMHMSSTRITVFIAATKWKMGK